MGAREAVRSRSLRLRVGRPRLTRAFILVFVVFYLLMIWLRSATGHQQDEIYPFFAWTLFSLTPAWERTENAVLVHDGEPTDGARLLIPNDDISDAKVLRRVVDACERDAGACDRAVETWLFPVVRRLTNDRGAEFSIVKAHVDLRAAQQEIRRLADGAVRKADFIQPEREIGRWTVGR